MGQEERELLMERALFSIIHDFEEDTERKVQSINWERFLNPGKIKVLLVTDSH